MDPESITTTGELIFLKLPLNEELTIGDEVDIQEGNVVILGSHYTGGYEINSRILQF